MKAESRDALLTAIGKARRWIDDIRLGRIASFAEIAKRETQGERHIRLLAPLAFVSPRIISAIVDGSAPADLTVTGLAKALPHSWAEHVPALARKPGALRNGAPFEDWVLPASMERVRRKLTGVEDGNRQMRS
jgi:hypothetical protein